MASKYQTLSGFLLSPFNRKEDLSKDISYSDKYRTFVEKNSKTLLIILILLVVAIGVTYAWFTLTIKGEKKTVIHVEDLMAA